MKKVHLFGILFLSITILGSCSKTGPTGPQGAQGEQGTKGEQGTAGAQGIPGADGSTIYSDNGAPATDVGKTGDYYLDKRSESLYGPKTDAGWGNSLSLKGQQGNKGNTGAAGPQGPEGDKGVTGAKGDPGQDGKDGSQMLSGTSMPTTSIGKDGDYYWDKSIFTLYGPKTSSGWGSGIGLRGPKGEKGDPGNANVTSSGWLTFPEESDWVRKDSPPSIPIRFFDLYFGEAGEKDWLITFPHGYSIANKSANGVVLLYVKMIQRYGGYEIKLAPFTVNTTFYNMDYSYVFNIRYLEAVPQDSAARTIYPIAASMTGLWDSWAIKVVKRVLTSLVLC